MTDVASAATTVIPLCLEVLFPLIKYRTTHMNNKSAHDPKHPSNKRARTGLGNSKILGTPVLQQPRADAWPFALTMSNLANTYI